MNWRSLSLVLVLFLATEGKACPVSILSKLPPQQFEWETLESITPAVLRARPLANWPSRTWRRVAGTLSKEEILGIQNYLTIFEQDPWKATMIFNSKFSKAPETMNYVRNVEDNVVSCYLLLQELELHMRMDGLFLEFALQRLPNLQNVPAPLFRNGRVVSQIGLWALHTGESQYERFLAVVRQSPWAIVEFQPVFPRPQGR